MTGWLVQAPKTYKHLLLVLVFVFKAYRGSQSILPCSTLIALLGAGRGQTTGLRTHYFEFWANVL